MCANADMEKDATVDRETVDRETVDRETVDRAEADRSGVNRTADDQNSGKRGTSSVVIDRRRFLGLGLAAAAAVAPVPAWAKAAPRKGRALSFVHAHTGERLNVVYFADGRYVPSALQQINYILRDHRINAIKPVSPQLLDMLHALGQRLGGAGTFEVLSAYRSAETNALLSRRNRSVAKHSLHIEAKAIDIRIPGFRASEIARTARAMHGGGVGYYPRRGFVHVDVGDVRTWTA